MLPSFPTTATVPVGSPEAQALRRPMLDQPSSWPWLVAAWLAVDVCLLDRFTQAMASRGEPVDTARMVLDEAYAYECLAAAHSDSDDTLRRLAMALFESYQLMTQRRQTAPLSHLRH